MLAVLVNTLAVLLGSTVGLLARKGIPEKVSGAIMTAISLCTLYAGVSGMLKGENTLVLIVSMVLGTAAGTLLDLDGALARLSKAIESRFRRTDGKTSVAEGFVTASLLFCIGAMTFVGVTVRPGASPGSQNAPKRGRSGALSASRANTT